MASYYGKPNKPVSAATERWAKVNTNLDKSEINTMFAEMRKGRYAMVEAFLADGVDVNAQDSEGNTLLHWAIYRARPDLFKKLLYQYKVDPAVENRKRQDCLATLLDCITEKDIKRQLVNEKMLDTLLHFGVMIPAKFDHHPTLKKLIDRRWLKLAPDLMPKIQEFREGE